MSRIVRRRHLSWPACALLIAVGVVGATTAGASTPTSYFGSSLDHSPANAGSTCAQDGATGGAKCTHVGSFYPGFSGHAAAPKNGVVKAIRLRAEAPAKLHILIVAVRNVSSDHRMGQAKVVVNGPTLHPVGTGGIETFPVQLNVKKGDELAVNTTSNTAEYCSDGTPGQLLFDPPLTTSFSSSDAVDGCLMLVQAVMK